MTNGKLNEQLLIGFRVLMVGAVIGGATLFFNMNKNITIMTVTMQHMDQNVDQMNTRFEKFETKQEQLATQVQTNTRNIAVHENRINHMDKKLHD